MTANKHYRLELHFNITIDQSPILEESTDWHEAQYTEYQQNLFEAVLAHPETFRAFQNYLLVGQLESMNWQQWHDMLLGNPTAELENILPPAIAMLGASDQKWFADAQKEELFFECVEGFVDCFKTTIEKIEVVEVMK